jgi:hypothetical protein
MGARHKLNTAAINGILVVAGAIAFFCQSWTVFWVLVAILGASAIHSGDIRFGRRKRD